MKQKIFFGLLVSGAACIGFVLAPMKTYAAIPPDSCFAFSAGTITDYYNNQNDNTANPACPRNVDIPSVIGGLPVTNIARSSFGSKQLTTLTIPNSVTAIGGSAFSNNQLTSIIIPDSVITIDEAAFYYNFLTSVTLGNSLTSIGDDVFSGNQLTSLAIPDSVTSIGSRAFSSNKLTSLTIGSSVTSIGSNAFGGNQLTSLAIPDSVTSIEEYAFFSNKLTSLTIGSSVTSIGSNAFGANAITSVRLPASIMSLNPSTFEYQGQGVSDAFNNGDYQTAIDNVIYTRVYTADPSNPAGLQDGQQILSEIDVGGDLNGDGDQADAFTMGGHLINPSQVTVAYENAAGNTLAPSLVMTGVGLSSYLANQNETNDMNRYFRLGASQPFTAPAIAGYSITTPSSPHTMTLVAADGSNSLVFVYSNATGSPGPQVPGVPNTGVMSQLGRSSAPLVLLAGLVTGGVVWRLLHRVHISKQ